MKFLIVVSAVLAVAAAGTLNPTLLQKIKNGENVNVILELPQIMGQVEASSSLQALKGDIKKNAMVSMLQGLTSAAQAPFVATIKELGLNAEQYWVSNIVRVKNVKLAQLQTLSAMEGEFTLREEFTASVNPAVGAQEVNITLQEPQYGVSMIRAPEAWARTQGEGVTIGIIDTGVHAAHNALAGAHDGGWSDPYYNNAGPTDTHGHGTHCMGTILGRLNGVGVAPAAKFHACRGLNNQGSGGEAELLGCAQSMLEFSPTPAAVSNSWGGGQGGTWYNSAISAWRMAGIVPVFAIGNSGASCRTANSPGDQPNLISVGATTNTDAMASFSSRGRSSSGAMKPEVSAPGNNIVSCGTGANNYVTMSGTSMATPHVVGAIALYKSANPGASFDDIFQAFTSTVAMPTLSAADRNCGLEGDGDFPNNAYGYGRIDVGKAVGV